MDDQEQPRLERARAFNDYVADVERIQSGRRRATQPGWLSDAALWRDAEGNVLTNHPDGKPRYVMPRFERPMMEKTAELLCRGGGHVLNVGFGCGLVDEAIAARSPKSHTIVEAHPQVLTWMREDGWMTRPGVEVIADCWEDVDWTPFKHHFDAVYNDVFPFGAPSFDTALWFEIVRLILKPRTGVCVLYGTDYNDERLRLQLRPFRCGVNVSWATCEVHVPFVVAEWKTRGIGTHAVRIPWITLDP